MILHRRGGSRLALSLSKVEAREGAVDYADSLGTIAAHAQTQEHHLNRVLLSSVRKKGSPRTITPILTGGSK